MIKHTTGLSGEFRLILRDENLKAVYDSGWGSNTILNIGLDTIGGGASGTANPFNYWHVGNSAAAVAEAQTGLQGWIASSTSNIGSDVSVFEGSPFYEYSLTRTHRFNAGTINDTVREVGAGSDAANNSNFYARHLVVPVIPVSVDQVLDVAYKHTIWPQTGDTVQPAALTLDGDVFDVIVRGADLDRTIQNQAMSTMGLSNAGGTADQQILDGDIGTNLQIPSGTGVTSYGGGSDSNLAYVPSGAPYFRDQFIDWGLSDGNTLSDIRSLLTRFTGSLIQIQFDKNPSPSGLGIPKDGTKELDLTIRQTWARH